MKNLFLPLLVCFISVQTYAQITIQEPLPTKPRFGIKFGTSLMSGSSEITYAGNNNNEALYEVSISKLTQQYSFGLFGQKKFGWLYVEGNALYSSYGVNYDVKSYSNNDTPISKMEEKFGYVDLQVMAGLTHKGFRLGVGPVAHILANHTSDMSKMEGYSEKLRAVSYGFSGSIGYDISRFSFDVKYDKAFRSVGDHIYYSNKKSLFKETPDAITFTIGIALIK